MGIPLFHRSHIVRAVRSLEDMQGIGDPDVPAEALQTVETGIPAQAGKEAGEAAEARLFTFTNCLGISILKRTSTPPAKMSAVFISEIIPGGQDAQESTYRGLKLMKERMGKGDIVIVHDARPL